MDSTNSDDSPTEAPKFYSRYHAPEILTLIRRGIIDDSLKVCSGWVEQWNGTTRNFIEAPTWKELYDGYAKHPYSAIRQLYNTFDGLNDDDRIDYYTIQTLKDMLGDFVVEGDCMKDDKDKELEAFVSKVYKEWKQYVQLLFSK